MINVNSLKARRAELKAKAETLINAALNSGKDLAGDELTVYNGCVAELKNINAQIERHAELATFGPGSDSEQRPTIVGRANSVLKAATTLGGLLANANAEMRDEIKNIVAYLSGHVTAAADLKPSGDGGLIIPTYITTVLERNYGQFAPVVGVARIWGTDTGADQVFPVLSDSEEAEQLDAAAATGADATVSGDTPPTDLTGPTMKAYKLSSKPVFCPRETFTDSPVNIIEEVVGALLARIIRLENTRYTKGSGNAQAEGFLTNCSAHAVGDVALDLDIALDLAYTVPQLYRPQGVYMMADDTAKYLRKLKTGIAGDKRQLWADADATKGTPATLHGYPVVINNDMDAVGADGKFTGKNPLAFGDFKRFVVRQAEQNQPYAYNYLVPGRDGRAVILFRRSDSKLLVAEAIAKLSN